MISKTPSIHFFACGASEGLTRLNAYDGALLAANLGDNNLIKIGSSIPPNCRLTEPHPLPAGALVPAVYCSVTSDIPGEVISAGIATAYPTDETRAGLIVNYATPGHKEDIEAIVRRMAEEGMRMRGREIKDIRSIAVQHRVKRIGAVFAAVVLWGTD